MNRVRAWVAGPSVAVSAVLAVAGCGSGRRVASGASTPARTAITSTTTTSPPSSTTRLKPPARRVRSAPAAELPRMLGQMIVARFSGTAPPPSLLARIRKGQIGGVILFADNVVDGIGATRAMTAELQRSALIGGNPPLLITTDQEGGDVKRLPGPPSSAPSDMSSSRIAFDQGRATGRLLRQAGVNLDLAPVADVERVAGSFLGTRSFGSSASTVAGRACAFAAGLASEGVAYTLKHFPGLGRAAGNTDNGSISVAASPSSLRIDYQAYRECGSNPLALVMVSSAIYPNLTGPLPAIMSPATYRTELPSALRGRTGVTISDDLEAPAVASQSAAARLAINAGLDLLLYAQSEQAAADAYSRLLAEARAGLVNPARIAAASREIERLKQRVGS